MLNVTGNRAHNYHNTKPKTLKPSPNGAQYGPNGAQYSPNSAQYGPVMAICVRVILVRPDKNPRKIWSGGPKSLTKLSRYFGPGGPKSTTCCVLCDSISSNETSKRKRLQTCRVSLSEQALIQSMQVFSKQLVFLLQQLVQCTCTLYMLLQSNTITIMVLLLACFHSSAACMLWFCCLHDTVFVMLPYGSIYCTHTCCHMHNCMHASIHATAPSCICTFGVLFLLVTITFKKIISVARIPKN